MMRRIKPFSSVQVNFPQWIAEQVYAWGEKHISDDEIYIDVENMHFGREDEIHVTVLYGLHADTPQQTRELFADVKPFEITLGEIGVFTNSNMFDVVKIEVISDELLWLNEHMRRSMPHTSKFPVYDPHVTIAYVKNGKGERYAGTKMFHGVKVPVNCVTFSSRNNFQTYISLGASGCKDIVRSTPGTRQSPPEGPDPRTPAAASSAATAP